MGSRCALPVRTAPDARIHVSMATPGGGSSSAVHASSGDSDWRKCHQHERLDKQGEWQLEDLHGNSARCREANLETALLKKSSTTDTGAWRRTARLSSSGLHVC